MAACSRVFQYIVGAVLVCLLSQCTQLSPEGVAKRRQQQAIPSPYTMPVSAYLALAQNQQGAEKQALLLLAAGRAITDGDQQQGSTLLAKVEPMTTELADEKNLLLAKLDLMRDKPGAAINNLSNVRDVNRLAVYYQVQFHDMLASAYQGTHHPLEAVLERIKLDHLLSDDLSKANNRRVLWLSLTTLPQAELNALLLESSDNQELDGWVQLAGISRHQYPDVDALLAALDQWQSQFPTHSANYILPTPLDRMKQHLFAPPKHMALLLPTAGVLAGPARAIQDGFMAAYEASPRHAQVDVRVYNTNMDSVAAIYDQAIAEGADYIVGPLTKTHVTEIARLSHSVPTVLLNDVDTNIKDNAYQFGLSPASEARQVAARARKKGLGYALVIAPAGAWGESVVKAFAEQWREGGGQLVETLYFQPEEDLTPAIRQLLHVSASVDHQKRTKTNTSSLPMRRQDFDMVFLVAYPTKARQIVPLLRYYYAGNVPVYATSSVYSGSLDVRRDRDLDGVIFCDMPWVFSHQVAQRHWAEQLNSYNRLYALGLDSYALATQLNQLILFPALGVDDKSGVLYLTQGNRVARILDFAQFRQGVAEPLGDKEAS